MGDREDDMALRDQLRHIHETEMEKLCLAAIGDLGPARRHMQRLLTGSIPVSPMLFKEIERSIERCVRRLESRE